ncbi:MAG: hypothetical protein ABEH64_09625, partial [Salinirussus sp.]
RNIEETLSIGWELLSMLPPEELNRVDEDYIDQYYLADEQAEEVAAD